MRKFNKVFEIRDIHLVVEFNIEGVYERATQWQPAYYPDLEIEWIALEGNEDEDLTDLLSKEVIEEIECKIWEKYFDND